MATVNVILLIIAAYLAGIIVTAVALWRIAATARRLVDESELDEELPATPYALAITWPVTLSVLVWWIIRLTWREMRK